MSRYNKLFNSEKYHMVSYFLALQKVVSTQCENIWIFPSFSFYLKLRISKTEIVVNLMGLILSNEYLIQNLYFFGIKLKPFSRKIWMTEKCINFHTVFVRRGPFTALISKGVQLHTGHKFQKWIDKKSFFNSSVLSFFFRSSIGATFLSVTFFWIINDGLNFIKIVNSKS